MCTALLTSECSTISAQEALTRSVFKTNIDIETLNLLYSNKIMLSAWMHGIVQGGWQWIDKWGQIMETEQEEDEDLNRQHSEISAEEWGGIFERLNSVNNESDELIIDQVWSYLLVWSTCYMEDTTRFHVT